MIKHYRMYLDESGNPDMGPRSIIQSPYFGLCACFIEQESYRSHLVPLMGGVKAKFWGHDPDTAVIFHREDIVGKNGPFAILAEQATRHNFNMAMNTMYRAAEYTVVTVVVDKAAHKARYSQPRHVYHYCVEAVLERFAMFLRRRDGIGSVFAESRGRVEDQTLQEEWARLVSGGTTYVSKQQLARRLAQPVIEFRTKAQDIPGLQLADLLANPTTQDVLVNEAVLDSYKDSGSPHVCRAVADKYDCCQKTGKVKGYGRVLLSPALSAVTK